MKAINGIMKAIKENNDSKSMSGMDMLSAAYVL